VIVSVMSCATFPESGAQPLGRTLYRAVAVDSPYCIVKYCGRFWPACRCPYERGESTRFLLLSDKGMSRDKADAAARDAYREASNAAMFHAAKHAEPA